MSHRMKHIFLFVFLAAAAAQPLREEDTNEVFRRTGIVRSPDGKEAFHYRINGRDQAQEVTGYLKKIGETSVVVMRGFYTFITKDENNDDLAVDVNWIADELGYRTERPKRHAGRPELLQSGEHAADIIQGFP